MEIVRETEDLLGKRFDGFRYLNKIEKEHFFYKNYENRGLSIVVKITLEPYYHPIIECMIKVTHKENRLELKKTNIANGWQKVLIEKIKHLEWVVEVAPKCEKCEIFTIPSVQNNSRTGKKVVAHYCPKCRERTNTQYGIGLKTRLHPMLK